MKLCLAVLVSVGLIACSSSDNEGASALATSNQTRAPAAKTDAGAGSEAGSATSVVATTDASAPKPSTFMMEKTCADDTTGSCTFTANITVESDSDVNMSCLSLLARADNCQVLDIEPSAGTVICDAMSKSLKPEMAKMLECEGGVICEPGPGTCAGSGPTPTTLGDQLCAAITSSCENDELWFDCTTDGRATWNGMGGELRTDAAAAVLTCLQYECSEMRACLDAWQTAIGFPPAIP